MGKIDGIDLILKQIKSFQPDGAVERLLGKWRGISITGTTNIDPELVELETLLPKKEAE